VEEKRESVECQEAVCWVNARCDSGRSCNQCVSSSKLMLVRVQDSSALVQPNVGVVLRPPGLRLREGAGSLMFIVLQNDNKRVICSTK
jgi:hypothetical protein